MMERLGIGEVCKLLDIKAHVLRYWEDEIPLLDPEKNAGGRRLYGPRELALLYRLKYLIHERRFTLEGAKNALLDELSGRGADAKARVHALRKGLLDARGAVKALEEKRLRIALRTPFPPGQDHLSRIWKRLPEKARRTMAEDLRKMPHRLVAEVAALAVCAENEPSVPRLGILGRSGPAAEDAVEEFLASGRIGIVTLFPERSLREELAEGHLERIAVCLREAAHAAGRSFFWYIFAENGALSFVKRLFHRRAHFHLDPRGIVFVREPLFPYLDREGRLLVREDGGIAGYPSGHAGALLMIYSSTVRAHMRKRGVDTLCFLPLSRYSPRFPDGRLFEAFLAAKADLAFTCIPRKKGLWSTTGVYLVRSGIFDPETASPPVTATLVPLKALISGAHPADEIGEVPAVILRSGPYHLISRAGNVRAVAEAE